MTTVGFGDIVPSSALGRFVTAIWSVASYLAVSTLTAIMTTVLTSDSLRMDTVDALADVYGTLCIEKDYPLLEDFLSRDPSAPNSIIRSTVGACMDALTAGTVRAVMTDRLVLTWYASAYGLSTMHMSATLSDNPMSFVFTNTSTLRAYTNPAVIASRTHPDWVPLSAAINVFYFGTQVEGALDAEVTLIDTRLIVASVVLAVATVAVHVAQTCGAAAWLRARLAAGSQNGAAGKRISVWGDGGAGGGAGNGAAEAGVDAADAAGADVPGSLLVALVEEARAAAAAHADALAAAAATGTRVATLQERIGVLALSSAEQSGARDGGQSSRAALLQNAARISDAGGSGSDAGGSFRTAPSLV
jgi:hypothetical protein